MKQILKPDPAVMKIISGNTLPDEGTIVYKSQFIFDYKYEDKHVYYNTFTKEAILAERCEEIPHQIQFKKIDYYNWLFRHRFLIKKTDEAAVYSNIVSTLRIIGTKKGISTYTILPTTHCNARCFYCYEKDFRFKTMTEETEQRLIDFILKTHSDGGINIRWFGGEPLLGIKTIRTLSDTLSNHSIDFSSSMITNGSLFTDELIKEAISRWKLKTVQITLDGSEDEYNKRKNYIASEIISPFKNVMENIQLLQKHNLETKIRLNIDFDNLDSINSLIDDLRALLPDKNNIRIYCHPLYSEERTSKCTELWKKCLEINQRLNEYGFNNTHKRETGKLQIYHCMAANPNAVVIDPSGSVYACEHCNDESMIGCLNDLTFPFSRTDITMGAIIREKCRKCQFLPICTDFSSCPNIVYDCENKQRVILEGRILSVINKLTDNS